MQHDLQRSERERVSQDMMPYTAQLIQAVMEHQNLPKEQFASFVGDVHKAMIDISFQSLSIADNLGFSVGVDEVKTEPKAAKPARGSSVGSIVQSLLRPKETLFEPAVPHSVRVPSAPPVAPPAAKDPELPAVAQIDNIAQPRPPAVSPAAAPVARRVPSPKTSSVVKPSAPSQGSLALEAPTSPNSVVTASPAAGRRKKKYEGPERRSDPLADKPRLDFNMHLPRKLESIEEALTEDYIICLDDGKMVKDLEEYLRKKGKTPEEYRAKWKLPKEYPMIAPNALLKRGAVHEMDPVSGRIIKARF